MRLTLLGVLGGVLASLVVLSFRAAIDLGQSLLSASGHNGGYGELDPWLQLFPPVGGGLLLGLIFERRACPRPISLPSSVAGSLPS